MKMFMNVEKMLVQGARVVGSGPKRVGDTVQLTFLVGAVSDESKLKFLKSLEQSPEFSHIQLLSEDHPTQVTQFDRVVLSLQAEYSVI
jgi:hypothetical protein